MPTKGYTRTAGKGSLPGQPERHILVVARCPARGAVGAAAPGVVARVVLAVVDPLPRAHAGRDEAERVERRLPLLGPQKAFPLGLRVVARVVERDAGHGAV